MSNITLFLSKNRLHLCFKILRKQLAIFIFQLLKPLLQHSLLVDSLLYNMASKDIIKHQ